MTSVMRDHAPGRGLRVRFRGAESGETPAVIDSYDPILPFYSTSNPAGIARVYTNRCTKPGDSGAALVTEDGEVVGVATHRTKEDQELEFAVWMWAAGVLDALNADL
jgi:hypothetical protein